MTDPIPGSAPRVYDNGNAAISVLRVAAAVQDAETVTIGADVYEVDTTVVSGITAGRIRLDLSGGSTVASQGTLTIAEPVTANDTITVGATTYTFKAGATAVAGQIGIGGSEAATKLAIVAAINGTDAINAANASASAAAFVGDDCVLTALIPGTVGDAVVTTSVLTHISNVFDAVTLGTTTAGVDPTAGEFTTALTAAIIASGTENVTATRVSANEVMVHTVYEGSTTVRPSTDTTATTETGGEQQRLGHRRHARRASARQAERGAPRARPGGRRGRPGHDALRCPVHAHLRGRGGAGDFRRRGQGVGWRVHRHRRPDHPRQRRQRRLGRD
jgi:hypothetical protein